MQAVKITRLTESMEKLDNLQMKYFKKKTTIQVDLDK